MRVDLDDTVFMNAAEWALPLLWFGATGRHCVLPAANATVSYAAWHGALSARLRLHVELAVNDGTRRASREPPHHRVLVATSGVGALQPSAAFQLLQRPYRMIVENGINDRAFFLRLCPQPERDWLAGRLDREWLEFDHAGGIGGVPARVRELSKRGMPALYACLFDSDSQASGQLSKQATAAQLACTQNGVPHHVLQRRAMENYLPRSALERWISLGQDRKTRQARRPLVDAYWSSSARHHLHAKKTLGSDDVGELWANDTAMNDADIQKEGGPIELAAFVAELVKRAR